MSTQPEILEFLGYLEDFFGGEFSIRQQEICMRFLADAPNAVLEAAKNELCLGSKWLPKPVEIRNAVEAARANLLPDGMDLYWRGMTALSARLSGEISDDGLEADPGWRYCISHAMAHPPDCTCRICAGTDPAELEQAALLNPPVLHAKHLQEI